MRKGSGGKRDTRPSSAPFTRTKRCRSFDCLRGALRSSDKLTIAVRSSGSSERRYCSGGFPRTSSRSSALRVTRFFWARGGSAVARACFFVLLVGRFFPVIRGIFEHSGRGHVGVAVLPVVRAATRYRLLQKETFGFFSRGRERAGSARQSSDFRELPRARGCRSRRHRTTRCQGDCFFRARQSSSEFAGE